VTSIDDELFVLLPQDSDQLAVYCINDYRLLRRINLRGLRPVFENDLTSCARHRCLYLSDYEHERVHRYDLATSGRSALRRLISKTTRKWRVPGSPCGLSVTPSCNLLVTCHGPHKLVELSADSGQCVREIALHSDIECPLHGVQLSTGHYVVCERQTGWLCALHRVCIVDDDGRVTRSYGVQRGSGFGQLNCPLHLAVDKNSQYIFVADHYNHRVVLLSPTLEFVRYISEEMSGPYKLYVHQATRRLHVGQLHGDIIVIQLM